jgi:hypothetical protein
MNLHAQILVIINIIALVTVIIFPGRNIFVMLAIR